MNLAVVESEEQAAARVLQWRARDLLRAAPELVMHIRSLIVPFRAQVNTGMPRKPSGDPPAPMRLDPTDDADSVYAQLVNWVIYWAETLEMAPPSAALVAWTNKREVQGFRANTTLVGAHGLTTLLTTWLLLRTPRILTHPSAADFFRDVVALIGHASARYPMKPGRQKPTSRRPCPVCSERAISAEWFGEAISDVEVRCQNCGYEVPAKDFSGILKWLEGMNN